MRRRDLLLGWIALGVPTLAAKSVLDPWMLAICSTPPRSSDAQSPHESAALQASQSNPYESLIPPFQHCVQAAQNFIGYSQRVMASGDLALVAAQRTAIDTDAVCGVVLSLASLNSRFTPALARHSSIVMEAALETTLVHAVSHADCLHFRLACQQAMAAARVVA